MLRCLLFVCQRARRTHTATDNEEVCTYLLTYLLTYIDIRIVVQFF